jgi:glycoside/pentoside/hexuronide:cation symporter, GPH family
MGASRLPNRTKWTYGIGEMGVVAPVSVSVFFLLFFFTEVVGLSPGQAGGILLLGRLWDAIDDPLIGILSDATPTFPRWGRRYPWLIACAIPLGLICMLQWWVPPMQPGGLFVYYSCISILAFTLFTAIQVPFTALAAELTQGYDQRTQLMGFKSAFNILGSIVGLLVAQIIFGLVEQPREQYEILGWVLGGFVIGGLAIAILGTVPHYRTSRQHSPPSPNVSPISQPDLQQQLPPHFPAQQQLRSLLRNPPFRWLIGLYLCSWVGIQTTAAVLPYFVTGWMGLPEQHFIQMALTVQIASIFAIPLWSQLAQRTNKQRIYLLGAPLAIAGLLGLFAVQPNQLLWLYGWGAVLGLGLSTFYLVPLAMLPDVIDLDALQNPAGPRREGLFTSVMVFLQKTALAIALFLVTALLERSGWVTAKAGAAAIAQPESALLAIRWLMGPLPALTIVGGMFCAWRYPLTRQQHDRIVRDLTP